MEGEQGNKAFAAAHDADFPLLSDPTKTTASAYGVLNDRGVANRWTFYIGNDGRIQYIDKDVNAHLETSAEVMAAKLGDPEGAGPQKARWQARRTAAVGAIDC